MEFFVLLGVISLGGAQWHLAMLSRLHERHDRAVSEGDDRGAEVAQASMLRYRYRLLEIAAVVGVVCAGGILLAVLLPPPPQRTDLSGWQPAALLAYSIAGTLVATALVGGSGLLSIVDVRVWDGKPARLRDLPFNPRRWGEWFVWWYR